MVWNAARESTTALSHIFWVWYWSGEYIWKTISRNNSSHISRVLYQSGIEPNTKKHLLTTEKHLLKLSGTNFIIKGLDTDSFIKLF